jgi:phosphate transport system permease protein
MSLKKLKKRRDVHAGDKRFFRVLRVISFLIILIFAAIVIQLTRLSAPALSRFGFSFLFHSDWNPVTEHFGAASFLYGTVVSSLLALLFAAPVSIGVSLFLTELAPKRLANLLGFLVEMLAAIPSVVYGLWGVFVLAPLLREHVQPFLGSHFGFIPLFEGPPYGVGMFAAGIILAIMITPTISAICREVFAAVSQSQREAALALGATRWEMIRLSVLRGVRSGILGAIVLGLGRALGETMAVTMVIGNRPDISASLFSPAQTMASVIANEYAEATSDLHLSALAAIGLSLFAVSFVINSSARLLVWKFERPAKTGAGR